MENQTLNLMWWALVTVLAIGGGIKFALYCAELRHPQKDTTLEDEWQKCCNEVREDDWASFN